MGRKHLTVPLLLAVASLALVLPGLDRHGLWFDEAYTARLAALDWPRLVAGAQLDIHPPGWPLLAGLMLRLPLEPEGAIRLPAALSFAALVALVGTRSIWGGVALLLYGPLVEQAGQGRPYVPLALGLVGLVRLVERRNWGAAGLVLAGVASMHALGAALGGVVVVGAAATHRPRLREAAWLLGTTLVFSAWWLPAFITSAVTYARAPWYSTSSAADWWIVADAGGAAVAAVVIVAVSVLDRSVRGMAPALAVGSLLLAMESVGMGAEIRKTGIIVLPLLLAGLGATRRSALAAVACVGLVGVTAVRLPDRPDLREAQRAIAGLSIPVPVVSVFASEAAWYIRSPAPLPSFREAGAIAGRIGEVLSNDGAGCVVAISLPGTFPAPADLPTGTRTLLEADVTGLDVRLVGIDACNAHADSVLWHAVAVEE